MDINLEINSFNAFVMKCFLSAGALALVLSAYSQPSKEEFKTAIEKIEIQTHSKDNEKVISINVIIINDSIISLKDWWKRLMNAHLEFSMQMDTLLTVAKQEVMGESIDSAEREKKEEALQAFKDTMTRNASDTNNFDYIAYFKKKYEQTPASLKVYTVEYSLELQTNKGDYSKGFLRKFLNMKDLSDAEVP